MAFSAKQFSLFLLLTLLFSLHTHARDSQFFNKIPSTTNDVAFPIKKEALNNNQPQQDPTFLPENENGYGLYGHESGQNPPSTTTATAPYNAEFKQPAHKYIPKNYNPVAYVTQPEDNDDSTTFSDERSFSTDLNNYNNGDAQNLYRNQKAEEEIDFRHYPATTTNNNGDAQNLYRNQKAEEEIDFRHYPVTTTNNNGDAQNLYRNHQAEGEIDFRNYPATTTNKNDNYNYNGGSSFNSEPQGVRDTSYRGGATRYGGANGFQRQGMSDTRFMENGKYFYDVDAEKFGSNHPYERLKGVRTSNEYNYNRNFYGNAENKAYENGKSENSYGGYQNQDDFLDDESLP